MRYGRIAEFWAAISITVALLTFILLAIFSPKGLILGVIILLTLMAFIESAFRHRMSHFITNLTSLLAIFCGLLLIYQFFWWTVVFLLILAAGYMLWENLRELFS